MAEDPISLVGHIHGASVHFPIALVISGIGFETAAMVARKAQFRPVAFWCLALASAIALPALFSGLGAQFGWLGASAWDSKSMLTHRNIAFVGTGALLIGFIWRLMTVRKEPSALVRGLQFLLGLISAAAFGYAGYLGAYVARGY